MLGALVGLAKIDSDRSMWALGLGLLLGRSLTVALLSIAQGGSGVLLSFVTL